LVPPVTKVAPVVSDMENLVLKLVQDKIIDLNETNEVGNTPLTKAAENGEIVN